MPSHSCTWYRSMWSVPRRRRLASQPDTTWCRDSPASFGPGPIGIRTLVATSTWSRRPRSTSPTISSDWPVEYTSAVSIRLTPASRHMSTWRRASCTSVDPTFANAPVPANVIVPMVSTEIFRPELPSVRYSTAASLAVGLARGPCQVRPDRRRGGLGLALCALEAVMQERRPAPRIVRGARVQPGVEVRLVVHGGEEVDPLGAGHRADRPVQAGQQSTERRCLGVGHVREVGEVAAGLDPQRPWKGHVSGTVADQPVLVRHEPAAWWRVLAGPVFSAVVAVTSLCRLAQRARPCLCARLVLRGHVLLGHAELSPPAPGA